MSEEQIKHSEKFIRVGLNIALQRKLHKMTQIQLAEAIGISRTHMSNIEAPNMVTPVSLEVIFDIADTLNVSPEVFFKMDQFVEKGGFFNETDNGEIKGWNSSYRR